MIQTAAPVRPLLLLSFVACQANAERAPAAPIEVRDARGAVVATVRGGQPCNGEIAGTKLDASAWRADVRGNGTMLLHGGVEVARVVDAAGELGVFDPQGLPIVRIAPTATGASVADRASRLVRHATLQPTAIALDAPAMLVTGTRDVALAALLSAPEVQPEVRLLATCERLAKGSR